MMNLAGLGIKVLVIDEGHLLQMKVSRKEMTNGFNIAHGGITYALADSALAFAEAYGTKSVSMRHRFCIQKKL